MRLRSLLCVAGLAGALSSPAWASLILVEPDLYAAGTDIRTAFPGVTLSVVERPDAAVVPAIGTSVFLGGSNVSTTGDRVFARSPSGFCGLGQAEAEDTAKTWTPSAVCGTLQATFASPTDFVSIDVIFDDDDRGFLAAYDSMGVLLAEVFGSGDGRGPTPFVTLKIDRPARDIAFVTAGGIVGEGSYLDNLQFSVPEPGTLALVSCALFYMGFRRRSR